MKRSAVASMMILLAASTTSAAIFESTSPFFGVTLHRFSQRVAETDPTTRFIREVVVNTLEIDLRAPGVSVLMQPRNELTLTMPPEAVAQGVPAEFTPEFRRQTTRSFVNSVNAQIGVNLDFYSIAIPGTSNPQINFPAGPNGELFAEGIFAGASNGSVTSRNNSFEPIFNVSAAGIASILTAAGPGTTTTLEGVPLFNAQGGNQRLLAGGRNVTPIDDPFTVALHPRTALGVSRDGNRIFLMAVDGRQTDYSEGMRTDEVADLLRFYGAWDAINVDGGGSTTMVMDDTNDGVQNARVINSPSDGATGQQTGNERMVANNMAVFATPNPAFVPLPPVPRPPAPPENQVFRFQTVLDSFDDPNFNGGFGRFPHLPGNPLPSTPPYGWGSLGSGSNRGVHHSSTVELDPVDPHRGTNALKVNIVAGAANPNGFKLRMLSGGAAPSNNLVDDVTGQPILPGTPISNDDLAMGASGYVGFFIKLAPGSQPLWTSILLDDGVRVQTGLERASFQPVIADGQWHLYQWNLSDPDQWFNFAGGNGLINGPNTFIDALYFSSNPATTGGPLWTGSFWIDTIVYNPDGPIVVDALRGGARVLWDGPSAWALGNGGGYVPIPEPATLGLLAPAGLLLLRRRK